MGYSESLQYLLYDEEGNISSFDFVKRRVLLQERDIYFQV